MVSWLIKAGCNAKGFPYLLHFSWSIYGYVRTRATPEGCFDIRRFELSGRHGKRWKASVLISAKSAQNQVPGSSNSEKKNSHWVFREIPHHRGKQPMGSYRYQHPGGLCLYFRGDRQSCKGGCLRRLRALHHKKSFGYLGLQNT